MSDALVLVPEGSRNGAQRLPSFTDHITRGGETDELGRFYVELGSDELYDLVVMKKGFRTAEATFEPGALCVEVVLPPESFEKEDACLAAGGSWSWAGESCSR